MQDQGDMPLIDTEDKVSTPNIHMQTKLFLF